MNALILCLITLLGHVVFAAAKNIDLCRCEALDERLYSKRLGASRSNDEIIDIDDNGYYIIDGIRVLPLYSKLCSMMNSRVSVGTPGPLSTLSTFKCPLVAIPATSNVNRQMTTLNVSSSAQSIMTIQPDTPFEQLVQEYLSSSVNSKSYTQFLHEVADMSDQASSGSLGDVSSSLSDPQTVYLKFMEGNFTVPAVTDLNDPNNTKFGEFGPFPLYNYTEEQKTAITERLRKDFERFATSILFVTEPPAAGEDFTTVEFNARTSIVLKVDPISLAILNFSVRFGLADGIDFLNLNRADYASVDANFWPFLVAIGSTDLFYNLTGFTPDDGDLNTLLDLAVLSQSANTAAHELGHILGLRHIDSIGAPGDGLPSTGEPQNEEFVPPYKGPRDATETFLHLLASGASVALPPSASAVSDRFFSERSSIKLSLAFHGATILPEDDTVANGLALSNLTFPNTIQEGENAGSSFLQAAVGLIQGRISTIDEIDQYRTPLQGDRFLTIEVMSLANANIVDKVITRLTVFREEADGNFTDIIEASKEFETQDPLLFDFFIADSGTYVLQVDAPDIVYLDDGPVPITSLENGVDFLTGDYLLFAYSYSAPLEIVEDPLDPPEVREPSQEPSQAPTREPTEEEPQEPTKEPEQESTQISSKSKRPKSSKSKRPKSSKSKRPKSTENKRPKSTKNKAKTKSKSISKSGKSKGKGK